MGGFWEISPENGLFCAAGIWAVCRVCTAFCAHRRVCARGLLSEDGAHRGGAHPTRAQLIFRVTLGVKNVSGEIKFENIH